MSNSARDVNKCIIIAGACLKWQGKDCLQTTASKKHSPLSNEDILKVERMSDRHFQLLSLQSLLLVSLRNRTAGYLSFASVVTSVESLQRQAFETFNSVTGFILSLWFILCFFEISLALY